jgi:hypothetical protein
MTEKGETWPLTYVRGFADGINEERKHAAGGGEYSTAVLKRVATTALTELWADCFRRGDNEQAFQRELFREKVMEILRDAAGEPFEVIKVPRHSAARRDRWAF